MSSIRILTQIAFGNGESSPQTAQEALGRLFEKVRVGELSVEQALDCIIFEPREQPTADEPPRWLPIGRDGFRVLLTMVRDKVHPIEKMLSIIRTHAAGSSNGSEQGVA